MAAMQITEKDMCEQRSYRVDMRLPLPGRAWLHAPEETLHLSKHILDLMSLFIQGFVIINLDFSVLLRRHAEFNIFILQAPSEPIRVIAAIHCPTSPKGAVCETNHERGPKGVWRRENHPAALQRLCNRTSDT